MSLFEVRSEYLKKKYPDKRPRMFQDGALGLFIHVWENLESGKMEKIQVSWGDNILEWSPGKLRTGCFDEGDNPMGMKRSPLMNFSNDQNSPFVKRVCRELDHSGNAYLKEMADTFRESATGIT